MKHLLLTTSNFGEEIQGELDLYLTKNRLNEVIDYSASEQYT